MCSTIWRTLGPDGSGTNGSREVERERGLSVTPLRTGRSLKTTVLCGSNAAAALAMLGDARDRDLERPLGELVLRGIRSGPTCSPETTGVRGGTATCGSGEIGVSTRVCGADGESSLLAGAAASPSTTVASEQPFFCGCANP